MIQTELADNCQFNLEGARGSSRGHVEWNLCVRIFSTPERQTYIAAAVARVAGHPFTFAVSVLTIFAWAVSGPLFALSDTWQLVTNTARTIAIVFDGIPHSEHADSR